VALDPSVRGERQVDGRVCVETSPRIEGLIESIGPSASRARSAYLRSTSLTRGQGRNSIGSRNPSAAPSNRAARAASPSARAMPDRHPSVYRLSLEMVGMYVVLGRQARICPGIVHLADDESVVRKLEM
jgi:hypothetical protein